MINNDLNIHFNEDKTINAVLYIVSKIDRKDFHKIFKLLYFADRNHFADYGRPITGDNYIKMEDGPVPSNLYDIFKTIRGNGYYKDTDGKFSKFFSVEHYCFIKANLEPNLNQLSKTDLRYLDMSIDENGTLDYPTIRDKSHDFAWNNAIMGRGLSFENILREKGIEDEYIHYLKDRAETKKIFDK
ncbi:SocA family protein [Flavobacterium sp. ANB]|uniref:Panacea domain-containing protein n=1 Tax=unclassified Flavobacterium TaxID=196869 RepID=UPI0012B7C115|nr:Panacea domain-containing protein [Flavobacterium sp. ANB]MBF4515214.1 SocA family protein [Flavobacterium sp. ANB]MTD70126.1 DUF4065 domain-containing protein [Flavobacterium sp. LC2016-13]